MNNPAAGLSVRLRPSLKGSGPKPARIMIVGEAPFGQDMIKLEVFSSNGGEELTKMLHEAGIIRADCYLTNVIKVQPHGNMVEEFYLDKKCTKPNVVLQNYFEQLATEVAEVNPTLIIALGNTALLALTGKIGVSKWRGSMLKTLPLFGDRKVIPTYHPAAVIKNWEWRPIVLQDLRRAVHESQTPDYTKPAWNFTIRPSFPRVMVTLQELMAKADAGPLKLSIDIETRSAQIACVGIAWSRLDAICIPLMAIKGTKGSYWTEDEELAIRRKYRQLLAHPNVEPIGQNFGYDSQYFAFQDGIIPKLRYDTMLMHHTLFNQMKKSLDFMASLYCGYYVYWKDDGKEWDASIDEEQYWVYNCEDTVYTYELAEVLDRMLTKENLQEQYRFLLELWSAVMTMMIRGTRIDEKAKVAVAMELMTYMAKVQGEIDFLCDQPLNLASPKQVADLFYNQLGMRVVKNVKTKNPTTDDTALTLFPKREPIVTGLCERIAAMRSAGVLLSTFALMPLDADKRMRCYYNVAGTDTYRFNSAKNAFGNGGNLQNIPKGDDEESLEKKRAFAATGHTILEVPNIRKLFVPDSGKTFFDIDLDRADLMVVIAEADDLDLFAAVKEGVDLHRFNASALFNCPMDRVSGKQRQVAKMFAHGCVTAGHEVLTPEGWLPIEAAADGAQILVCNIDGNFGHFEAIDSWYRAPAQTPLINFEGEAVSQIVTADHTMPYRTDLKGYKATAASRLPASARLPKVVIYDGPVPLPYPQLQAAFAADGSEDSYGNVTFHFKKERKIIRMRELLKAIPHSENAGVFYISSGNALPITTFGKYLTADCLSWSHASAVAYLEEQVYWDGHSGDSGGQWRSSIIKAHAEYAHTLAHLHGYGSQLNYIDRVGKQRLYRFSLNNRVEWRLSSATVHTYPSFGQTVYCPVTSTGFWLVRHNGRISVTGNTNYGGSARTMAINCGLTVHESERMQNNWFAAHPGIKEWHRRTEQQLQTKREVRNAFGFRSKFFGRVEALLPEALAWIPQSTVSIVINKGFLAIHNQMRDSVDINLQVHDSIAGQYLTRMEEPILRQMKPLLEIPVPYPKPLIIGVGIKTSTKNWGEVEERSWPKPAPDIVGDLAQNG